MKIVTLRLLQNLVVGWLCIMVIPQVLALPIVESRTGEPMVRSPQDRGGSSVTAPEDTGYASYSRIQQLESLKEELNLLRGSIEEKQHALEGQLQVLKKSQQDFYVDLDKRLTQLEGSKGGTFSKQATTLPAKTPSAVAAPRASTVVAVPAPVATNLIETEISTEEEPVAIEPKTSATTPSNSTEKACYEAASASLSAKHYPEAIKGFQDCVARYPQGTYTAQCYYWLGESYMAQWASHKDDKTLLDKASQSFLMVTTRFPTHQRATDALLKLGMVEQEKGNLDVSKRYFEQVRDRYPDSAAARIAESHLQED